MAIKLFNPINMITQNMPKNWNELQNEVGKILQECGFNVEIEKKLKLSRGSKEVDVYAQEEVHGRKYSIICECKDWKRNIPQDVVHSFTRIVRESGCDAGYIITSSKFQKGSLEAATFTNIRLLTWGDFQTHFFDIWYSKYFYPSLRKELSLTELDAAYPIVNWFDDMEKIDRQIFYSLKNRINQIFDIYDYFPSPFAGFTVNEIVGRNKLLPLKGKLFLEEEEFGIPTSLPRELLEECSFRSFLDLIIDYKKSILGEYLRLREKYDK